MSQTSSAPSVQATRERAIISGATSGIGEAIALRLGSRGALVGLMGRNEAKARKIADDVAGCGGSAIVLPTDVTDPAQVARSVDRFIAEAGGVETVVASAGIALTGSVTDSSLEDWDRIIATNLSGVFYLARCTIPELIKTRGTFTAISSDAGVQAACGFSAYIASKHAVNGLIMSMALDYGGQGVRSNVVCPSLVETPMARQLLDGASPADMAYYKAIVPLGRFAQPEEVAAAVAHLSSPEASYANGLVYRLDGGATAGYYMAAVET